MLGQTHMQHEFGVSVDEFDESEKEALVTSGVQFCGFLFELKAGGHFPFECQTLWEGSRQHCQARCFQAASEHPENMLTGSGLWSKFKVLIIHSDWMQSNELLSRIRLCSNMVPVSGLSDLGADWSIQKMLHWYTFYIFLIINKSHLQSQTNTECIVPDIFFLCAIELHCCKNYHITKEVK